ncbi:hypothetical protein J4448_03860 [Candidatus Woesearchaeota archaeon]|nr:hypothetical protein [Candidatus Woesearchaeota archaeon]
MINIITKNTPLKEVLQLAAPCRCNSCNHGCKFGSGSLVGDDSKNIARFLNIPEEDLKKGFLEEIELFNKKLQRPKLIREKGKPYVNKLQGLWRRAKRMVYGESGH